jgi:hypothetical protein
MTIDELYAHLLDAEFGDVLHRYADGMSLADFDIQREGRPSASAKRNAAGSVRLTLKPRTKRRPALAI